MILVVTTFLLGLVLGAAAAEMHARRHAPRSTLTRTSIPDAQPGEVVRLQSSSGPAGVGRLVLEVSGTEILLRDLTRLERWSQNRWRGRA
jgi:hypothetical protein